MQIMMTVIVFLSIILISVITYVDGIYQLCQCLCTRAKTGYKPDSDKWEECWMDDIDLEYQAYIRVIEKTGDIKKR